MAKLNNNKMVRRAVDTYNLTTLFHKNNHKHIEGGPFYLPIAPPLFRHMCIKQSLTEFQMCSIAICALETMFTFIACRF